MDFHKALVFVWSLCGVGLNAFTADKCEKALEGGSYTIALNSPQQEGDSLVWKHNENVVYQRRRTKITGGVVDDNGSLLLNNLTSAMSGTYRAEHHGREATLIKTITKTLCVIPKAPVPTLALTCPSSGVPALQCDPKNIPGFTLSWIHNNKEIAEKKNPLQPQQRGEKELYTCRLSNDQYRDDKEDSKPVAALCADSSCHMTLEGQSFAITLGSPKQDGDTLVWRCNETVIYERRNGTIKGSAEVDDRGSLSLTNLTTAMSCTYRAEHWSKSAMQLKKTTANVCVVPKAPVPTLVVTCSSSGVGSLYCASGSSKGFTLSWFHNNVELKERVNPFTPTQPGKKDQYKCRLSNDLYLGDTQDSNDVIISCPRPDECTDKLEGSTHTIVLDLPEKSRGSLTWKCNDTTIYPSKKTARVQSTVNVDKKGSLSLAKLTTSMSGTYTAEYRVDKISATKTERLCVLPRAPVPKLSVKCSPVGEATLYCDPKPAAGFTLSWFSNNMELNDSSNPFQPRQHGEKHSYRCRLSNRLDKQDSNAVPVSCRGSGPSASDARQLCVSKRLVLVVLAGAALLFLVLTLALVIVSCKYCQQRNRKQVHEHVRLSSLRDTRADPPQWKQSPPGDQGYSHTPQGYSHTPQEDPSPAASQPGDQGYSHTPQEDPSPAASQPGAQPPPQPAAAAAAATAAENPPHTPVPQPRKKLNLIPKANDSDTSANGQDCV